jgi:hypothetical protein
MKEFSGESRQHSNHEPNPQIASIAVHVLTDRSCSSPRASLAFSALAVADWIRAQLSILTRRITLPYRVGDQRTKKSCQLLLALLLILLLSSLTSAQQIPLTTTSPVIVPRLVSYSGHVSGVPGKAVAGMTFSIYREQDGGAPLWMETQNVSVDAKGNYTAQLGAGKSEGLPLELFNTSEPRWLGVRVNGGEEQPRVLLLSVPYALKAADAETIGGLPPSAFVLAAPPSAGAVFPTNAANAPASVAPAAASNVTTNGGTVNLLPLWTTATNIQNSALAQTGSGATAKIGIGTTAPASALDVHGTVRGAFTMPALGAATVAAGKTSQPVTLTASTFNSSAKAAVAQNFRWQAEPAGNNTAGASGTLNLLFGRGAAAPGETGLKIASNGHIAFASGQAFPGTGTVTSVGLSAPVSDFSVSNSPVNSNGTLNLEWVVSPTPFDVATAIVKRDSLGNFAAHAISALGVQATTVAGTNSALGPFSSAIVGINQATGAVNGFGVFGDSNSGIGAGVIGASEAGGIGMLGQSGFHNNGGQGVWGESVGAAISDNGFGPDGVDGIAHAAAGSGVAAINTASGDGLFAQSSGGLAGHFEGNVDVNGNLSKNGGSFKIDHPLDPANKYLYHSFVESPDMMNIYNGNVTTNAMGEAAVTLPEWFEALNRDFRYQLTVIGQFAQAIIGSEIANNRFTIRTDKPNVKISWQVTGIRQDAWANAHRIPTEQLKPANEQGLYQHPELFGMPKEKSIGAAKHPGAAKAMNGERTSIAPGFRR